MKLRPTTIAGKLTWMNLVVTGLALAIACLGFFVYDQYAFRQALVNNLSAQAQIIGANSVSALTFNDPAAAEATLSALHSFKHVITAGIITPDGQVFAEYARQGVTHLLSLPTLGPGQIERAVFSRDEVILVRAIELEGKVVGTVFIRADLDAIVERLHRYALIAFIVLVLCMTAALFASRAVSRSVATPIVELADTAERVSRDKDYTVRAARSEQQGEIALLIEAFNSMLSQIQLRETALRDARDQLEQKVQERTRDLLAANRELEAFSYSVSHDLRGPLETINGFSYLLTMDCGTKLDQAGRTYLQHVRDATRRMSELIDDLLNLSRVSTTAMHKTRVDLTELTREIAKSLSEREPHRHVEFVIHDCKPAEGDPRLLQIAIENLVSNAWKYTSGRERARIEFGCNEQVDRVVYFIRDNGAGFDPKDRDRLFRPFQRLHSEAEFPGTGVGLATVQRIVQRHGGDIWADAQPNQGATFYFTLAPRMAQAGDDGRGVAEKTARPS